MEVVKYRIHDQDLPMYLWAKALNTAVYVQNRLSHSARGNKTPEEMFTGENPEVKHLKIFGCHVYLHVPKEKRSKLDRLGKKGIFVGYSDQSKSYKSISQVFVKLRSTEMSHLMKMQLSTNSERPMHINFMKKSKKLP